MAKSKSKKPSDLKFTQQKMAAWQPILSPPWVIGTFILIFLIFTPLGVVILLANNSIVEVSFDYTDSCTMKRQNDTGALYCKHTMKIDIPKLMKAPVYMYYKLDNFYQNHRRYASSRNDYQLAGYFRSASDLRSDCYPIVVYGPDQNVDAPEEDVYNPCGLIAWSMFNDTFILRNTTGIVCNGPSPDNVLCTKEGIAWSSDVQTKFKPPYAKNRIHPQEYYNETGHKIPSTTDPDFIVWMRTAALPNFRKLYRIINVDLTPDTSYFIEIEQNYPVKASNQTFSFGRKSVILSTGSWIGGKNLFLAVAYLSVAGLCLLLAIGFGIAAVIYRYRRKPRQN